MSSVGLSETGLQQSTDCLPHNRSILAIIRGRVRTLISETRAPADQPGIGAVAGMAFQDLGCLLVRSQCAFNSRGANSSALWPEGCRTVGKARSTTIIAELRAGSIEPGSTRQSCFQRHPHFLPRCRKDHGWSTKQRCETVGRGAMTSTARIGKGGPRQVARLPNGSSLTGTVKPEGAGLGPDVDVTPIYRPGASDPMRAENGQTQASPAVFAGWGRCWRVRISSKTRGLIGLFEPRTCPRQ